MQIFFKEREKDETGVLKICQIDAILIQLKIFYRKVGNLFAKK